MRSGLHHLLDGGDQVCGQIVLGDKTIRASRSICLPIYLTRLFENFRGQQRGGDDFDLGECLAKQGNDVEAVHFRHLQIQQYNLWVELFGQIDPFPAASGCTKNVDFPGVVFHQVR